MVKKGMPEWLTLASVLDAVGDGVLAFDDQGSLVHSSKRAQESLERDDASLLGLRMEDLWRQDFGTSLTAELERLKEGHQVAVDCPFLLPSGGEKWARVSLASVAEGGVIATLTLIDDFKEDESLGRESQAQFDAVFDNLPFECWVLDREGMFVLQNPESSRRWGPLCNRTIEAAKLPAEIQRDWYTDFKLAKSGKEARREVTISLDTGTKHFSRLLLPIRDGDEILGVLGVCDETTERRNLEEQLIQSQKLDAVGRLAGGIAHDFNNVLTAIMSCVRLLERRLEGPPRRELQIIRDGAQRASELTRQLLAFAKQEMTEPRRASVDDIVVKSDRLLRRLIGEDIDLVTSPDAEGWHVVVDPVRLEQVIINLVVNARDAMPKGGKITVRACAVDLTSSRPSVDGLISPGSYALISVEDEGVGMSEDTKSRAFEPFFTTRQDFGGTGLGLSSVYGSVHQALGHVTLESTLGEGTKVGVYLPRAAEEAGLADSTMLESEGSVAGGTETILLVEDEAMVMSVTCQTLRMSGYTVLEARGLDAALAVARNHDGKIDLLLTDVVMPKGTGPELATKLREERPDIVVLFMSGYPANRIDVEIDPISFLAKPFSPDRLEAQVRKILDASGSS